MITKVAVVMINMITKDKNSSPNKEKKQQQQQYLQQNSHSSDYQDTNIMQIGNTNFKMEAVSTIK